MPVLLLLTLLARSLDWELISGEKLGEIAAEA